MCNVQQLYAKRCVQLLVNEFINVALGFVFIELTYHVVSFRHIMYDPLYFYALPINWLKRLITVFMSFSPMPASLPPEVVSPTATF